MFSDAESSVSSAVSSSNVRPTDERLPSLSLTAHEASNSASELSVSTSDSEIPSTVGGLSLPPAAVADAVAELLLSKESVTVASTT